MESFGGNERAQCVLDISYEKLRKKCASSKNGEKEKKTTKNIFSEWKEKRKRKQWQKPTRKTFSQAPARMNERENGGLIIFFQTKFPRRPFSLSRVAVVESVAREKHNQKPTFGVGSLMSPRPQE